MLIGAELDPVFAAVRLVRRRSTVSTFLLFWVKALAWSAAVLAAGAVFVPRTPLLLAAGAVLVAVTGLAMVRSSIRRLSVYQSACLLDRTAGLRDQISTAVHFAAIERPHAIISHQRRSALRAIADLNPADLVPWPGTALARPASVFIVAVAVMMIISGGREPLLVGILEGAPSTPVIEAFVPAPGRGPIDEPKELPAGFGSVDAPEAPEGSPGDGSAPISQPGARGAETGSNAAAGRQSGSGAQERAGAEPGISDSGAGARSLTSRVAQALKDFFDRASGQAANSPESSRSNTPAGQNAGNQRANGQAGTRPQPSSDARAPGRGTAGEGSGSDRTDQAGLGNTAGGNPGSPDAAHNELLPPATREDVVALASTNFTGEATIVTTIEAADALVPLRNASATGATTTNGTGQTELPVRYRSYVRRYFSRPDASQP